MIESLERKIREMATAYYEGRPIASDQVFDQTLEELRSIDPNNKVLSTVGWGYEVKGEKRPHKIETRGLDKIKEDSPAFSLYWKFPVTPKYDGISVVLYYDENGVFEEALTRGGDSGFGKPVTHNLLTAVKKKGLFTVDSEILAVSCEIIVSIDNFNSHLSSTYELPRSAAAGISQTLYAHPDNKYLEIMPYKIHFRSGRYLAVESHDSCTEFNKIVKVPYTTCGTSTKELESWVNSLGYPQDGVVLADKVALKFDTEIVETEVIAIKRNVTRLGNLIPVLDLKPVRLYGTTVSRCTMVNEGWVESAGVGPGSIVKITKANQIIPQYIETVESVPYVAPTECPSCRGPLSRDGDHLVCVNNCLSESSRISSFVFTFAPLLGYSSAALNKILQCNKISTFDQLLERVGFLTSEGLTEHETTYLNFVNSTFLGTLDKRYLLASLNLPGIGWTWSEKLAPHLDYYLTTSQGFPFYVNYNVFDSINENQELIRKVRSRFDWEIPSPKAPGDQVKVTITGKLSMTKDEFCKKYNLVQVGLNESKLLICSDPNSSSNKMQTARKIGASIMTESEFVKNFGV